MRLLLVPALLLVLHGCSGRELAFESGELLIRTRLEQAFETGVGATERLTISEAVAPLAPDSALRLEIDGRFDSIEVYVGIDDADRLLTKTAGIAADRYALLIPLSAADRFDTILVRGLGADEAFAVSGVGFANRTFAATFAERVVLDTAIKVSHRTGNPQVIYELGLSELLEDVRAGSTPSGIEITYRSSRSLSSIASRRSDGEDAVTTFELSSSQGVTADYRFTPAHSEGTVFLHEAAVGFIPERLRINSGPGFSLSGVRLSRSSESDPIPADLAAILEYDQLHWRDEAFELFRWARYPSILIIDTRSYSVQASFFKRLAFFVEKRGFAGRVLTDPELVGRHGWNAHDYKAIDLAAFFSVIDPGQLTAEELTLRRVLRTAGIIRDRDSGFSAGDGGIISISRESPPSVRRRFLIHEGFHGLFFANKEYRTRVSQIWAKLGENERRLWRRLFESLSYNSNDEYLMINEFQAYLMQQPAREVDRYFLGSVMPRLKNISSLDSSFVDRVIAESPSMFTRAARLLAESAAETAGIQEEIFSLVRIR